MLDTINYYEGKYITMSIHWYCYWSCYCL